MPITECENCGGHYDWLWEEAFDKFGFNDGDGQIETWQVENVLVQAGYEVEVEGWGLHNTVITSIKKDGVEKIPYDNSDYAFGYDDPRQYFPADIITLLDKALSIATQGNEKSVTEVVTEQLTKLASANCPTSNAAWHDHVNTLMALKAQLELSLLSKTS